MIGTGARTACGCRQRTEAGLWILHFVGRTREFGSSVGQIAQLLGLWLDDGR